MLVMTRKYKKMYTIIKQNTVSRPVRSTYTEYIFHHSLNIGKKFILDPGGLIISSLLRYIIQLVVYK